MSGSKIRLYGSTSGFVELEAPAVAPDGTLTLPSTFAGIGSNVVQAVKTDVFSTTSGSYVAVTGMTASITPSSDTSKVLVIVRALLSNATAGGGRTFCQVVRGATAIGNTADGQSIVFEQTDGTARSGDDVTFVWLDSPATDTSVTYSLEMKTNGGFTGFLGRLPQLADQTASSTFTLIEVAA